MTKKARLIAEYTKERNRITNKVRQMKKAGFDVSGIKVPKTAKQMSRVTEASVRRLKKMTTRSLTEKATKVVEGETITARQEQVRRRWKSADKRRKKKVELPTMEAGQSTTQVVQPTTAVEPAPELKLSEIELLASRLYDKIDKMADYNIPAYAKGASAICREGLDEFMQTVDEDADGVANALRGALNDKVINSEFFDSDQVALARQWRDEMIQLANYLNSNKIREAAESVDDLDEADDNDWMEVSDEFNQQYSWMLDL